jgi:hypothetical protein
MRMNKHKTFEIINYLARDTAKAPSLNMHDDAIQQGAGLSPTDAAATQSEVRSGPITSDYYSVLARAVSELPNNIREARQALYDRAEVALVAELLQDPQVSEAQVTDERLAFERAIRMVERDTRKKMRRTRDDQEQPHGRFSSFRSFFRVVQRP